MGETPFQHLSMSAGRGTGTTNMLAIGMLLDEDEPFGTLMQQCALIEERANGAQAG